MKILIVGAGVAGLAMFRQLTLAGFNATLVEKSASLPQSGGAICLPAMALKALNEIGLKQAVLQHAHPVNEIRYETAKGKLLSKASLHSEDFAPHGFVALERTALIKTIAHDVFAKIKFNTEVQSIVSLPYLSLVTFSDGTQQEFDLVIGADGINSTVRTLVYNEKALLNHKVDCWRFVLDMDTQGLEPRYLLGKHEVFMFYPIGVNKVYCYAQCHEQAVPDIANTKQKLKSIFAKYDPVVLKSIEKAAQFAHGKLKAVESREIIHNRVVLIGDAMHGCPPSLQQGVALALEDVIILMKQLELHDDIDDALLAFKGKRLAHIDWVINTSNKVIRLAQLGKNPIGRLLRNTIVRITGPQNVKAWRRLIKLPLC
jgi:2-polyprenyl-6-methoxyphenol hydroxylase-like FAD-dependent oxidoreductase